MREHAFKLAAAGWRVIPLTPGDKKPLTEHGFKDGTTEAAIITAWWTCWPDANIGVCTGNGLVVLDVDCKDGKDGWKALAAVGITREFLDGLKTYTVTTPTLGSHYWFYSGEPVRGGQDVLGPGSGVDLRAEGGYIVAPPSRRPEGTYLVSYCGNACDSDQLPRLSKLASWSALGDKIHRPVPPPPPPRPLDPITDEELQQRVGRAKAYLGKCPGAVSGQNGHNQTFFVASALVNGFMLPPEIALGLLVADYNPLCQPPWSASELEHKVSSAQEKGPPEGKPYGWLLDGPGAPEVRDRRAITSPQNGANGGRKPIDCTALAEAYKAHFGTHVRWCNGAFYEYDSGAGFWRLYTEKQLGARVAAFLNTKPVFGGNTVTYSRNLEANVVGALRATTDLDCAPPCFLDEKEKDASGWAAMQNGLLDIEAAARGETESALHDFTPNFFSQRHFPFSWNPAAKCPRFMSYLEGAQPDPDGRKMLRMLSGLLLVPDTSYNVFFILQGAGGCGMSTFLKILNALLGQDNICSVTLSEMSEKHTAVRLTRTLADLVDDSATVDGSKFGLSLGAAEGLLKRVTSGAMIHCEPKGVDPWEAPATARCVFCVNPPLPPFVDRTTALWDRLRLVPFTQRFRGTERQIPDLAKEIVAEELPGIFAWAVSGLGELRKLRVFPQSSAGAEIIDEHRQECDRERTFLLDRYEYSQGATTLSSPVYSAYADWCKENGYSAKNNGNFAGEVRRVFPGVIGPRKTRENRLQQWRYLNLARKEEPLPIFNKTKQATVPPLYQNQDLDLGTRLEDLLNRK